MMVERRSAYLSLLILAPAVAVSCRSSSDHAAARSPLAAFKDAVPSTWPYPIDAPPAVAAHGMIATDAPLATRVGAEVLRKGGNAVDAAVATAFALAVVYPAAGNIGGGGFMVARIDGAPHTLDFREKAPLTASHDMYKPKPADGAAQGGGDSRLGHLAAGVPGSVAGLWEAFYKLGSRQLTWAEVLAPA